MTTRRPFPARGQYACVGVACLGVLVAVLGVGHPTEALACERLGDPNSEEIEKCNQTCLAHVKLLAKDVQESISIYSNQCLQSCRDVYAMGLCHCRQRACLDSLTCSRACFHSGVFKAVSLPLKEDCEAIRVCTRTSILPSRRLDMVFYWLPRNGDMNKVYDYIKLHLKTPVNYISEASQWESGTQEFNISHPTSFRVVGTLRNSEGLLTTPYSHYYTPWRLYFQTSNVSHSLGECGKPAAIYYSPECRRGSDSMQQCEDPEYAVLKRTDYYPPLRAYNFTVTGEEVTPGAFSQKLPVTDSAFLYRSAIQLTWNYQYAQFDKTATPDNKPVHACWCWDSCAIKHNITVYVIVDGRVVSTLVLIREDDTNLTEVQIQGQRNDKIAISLPAHNLFRSEAGDHVPLEVRYPSKLNITVNVTVQSYFQVDRHFGPSRPPWSFSASNIIAQLVSIHQNMPSSTQTTVEERRTSVAHSPETPYEHINATADSHGSSPNGAVVTATVLAVILGLALAAGLLKYACHYRKWRCVRKNKNLERVKQFRPLKTSTNTEYVPAAEIFTMSNDGLQRVPRRAIHQKERLGSGQFGDVYKALVFGLRTMDQPQQVAVKVLKTDASDKDQEDFLREAKHLNAISHPHVVQLLGVCLEDTPKMILLELMDGGNLLSYLQEHQPGAARPAWDDAEYLDIALDITAGLRYLESKKYVHRDIAARNCLLSFNPANATLAGKPSNSGRVVKISDFGLTRVVCNTQDYYRIMDNKALLPIRWMSPESLEEKLFTGKSDVWSFGILFWEIFTYGQTPYGENTSAFDVYKYIMMGGVLEQPQFCPPAMYRIMKQCWAKTPSDRPAFCKLHDLMRTFQQRLQDRRTTLLTTLESFASVSGIGDVDNPGLPRIPGPQHVAISTRAEPAAYGAYEDDSELSDNAFDSSEYPSESDNAFESPHGSPHLSRHNLNRPHHTTRHPPLTQNHLLSVQNPYPRRQRYRRKSRSHSTSREDVALTIHVPTTVAVATIRTQSRSSSRTSQVPSVAGACSGVFADDDGDKLTPLSHAAPPMMVTEFCPRKPLSPIVSASSVPDDDARSQRRSRTESSGSVFASPTSEEAEPLPQSPTGSSGSTLSHVSIVTSL